MDDHHFNYIAKMEKKKTRTKKQNTAEPDKCITIFTKINRFFVPISQKMSNNAINVFAIKKQGLHSSNFKAHEWDNVKLWLSYMKW